MYNDFRGGPTQVPGASREALMSRPAAWPSAAGCT